MLRCVSMKGTALAVAVAAVTVTCIESGVAANSANPLFARDRIPPRSSMMHVAAETIAPAAFYDFCRRTPHMCEADAARAPGLTLTSQRWAELVEVNNIVNATVAPRSDRDGYGTLDYWTIAGKFGDCEDYALAKQWMLRERGWPMSMLLMTVVRDENGEGHAVLSVRTSRGDLVLDNRQSAIVAWDETPYRFVKRQSILDPRIWMTLNTRAPGDAPMQQAAVRESYVGALPLSRR